MTSRSPLLLAVLLALALPTAARAADPLLSGYAGPGGGEQVVLGGGAVRGGSGGGGPSGGAPATADESLRAATPTTTAAAPSAGAKLTSTPQKRKSSSSSASHRKTMPSGAASSGSHTSTTTAPVAPAGAPRVVAYPTRAGAVGTLPISAGGLLALVAAIAVFVLAGLGLRRLIAPQVSAG